MSVPLLNPDARRGGNPRTKAQVEPLSHADAIAQATGRSKTTVNQVVARWKRITPDVRKLAEGTALETGSLLDRLAKLPDEEQRKLITDGLADADRRIQCRAGCRGLPRSSKARVGSGLRRDA